MPPLTSAVKDRRHIRQRRWVWAEACVDQRIACVHDDPPSTGMTITLRRLPDGAEIDFERKDQLGRQGATKLDKQFR
ncbi:hypothetical protein BS630_34925 [Rhizobium laguerreae]|nr:hypothetical protein BS630_34925 [Rhizobium laguerreae]